MPNLNQLGLRRQQGFTLVEMAIVLVIIGLLLGGILKGQELITSARVRNIADQNSGVQAAYYGFIDRYRQVPGDWGQANAVRAIPGVITGGNADGRLNAVGGNDWVEALALWEHLSKSRFIQGNYVGGNAQPNADDTDQAPRNAFNGFLMLYRTSDYNDPAAGTPTEQLNLVLGAGIPVNVLAELDRKIDDGLPESGVLRNALDTGTPTFGTLSLADANCITTDNPPIWDIESNVQLCNAVYLY